MAGLRGRLRKFAPVLDAGGWPRRIGICCRSSEPDVLYSRSPGFALLRSNSKKVLSHGRFESLGTEINFLGYGFGKHRRFSSWHEYRSLRYHRCKSPRLLPNRLIPGAILPFCLWRENDECRLLNDRLRFRGDNYPLNRRLPLFLDSRLRSRREKFLNDGANEPKFLYFCVNLAQDCCNVHATRIADPDSSQPCPVLSDRGLTGEATRVLRSSQFPSPCV